MKKRNWQLPKSSLVPFIQLPSLKRHGGYGRTSTTKRAVVAIDAGIVTEENLEMLRKNDFDYVCVSRSKLKNYRIDPSCCPVEIEDRKKQKIQLQKVISEKHNDSAFYMNIVKTQPPETIANIAICLLRR